jgi:hypothetical protein
MRAPFAILPGLWLTLVFPQLLSSQQLQGKVRDQRTQQPVAAARVFLSGTGDTAVTGSDGAYLLKVPQSGMYNLLVQCPGYEPLLRPDVWLLPDKVLELELHLQPLPEALASVTVRRRRTSALAGGLVSMHSFGRDEISLNPGAQGDIFRAIGMLPGVSSSGGIYSAIAVRGQGVRDNVYMVDDIPVSEVGHLEGNGFFNDPNGGRFSIFAPRVVEKAVFSGGGFGPEYGRRSAAALSLEIREGNRINPLWDGQLDLFGLTLNYDGPLRILPHTSAFFSGRVQHFWGLVNIIGIKDVGMPRYADFVLKTVTRLNDKNRLSFLAVQSPERFVRTVDYVRFDTALNLLYTPDFRRTKTIAGLVLRTQLGARSHWKQVLHYTAYRSRVSVGRAFPDFDPVAGRYSRDIRTWKNALQTQDYREQRLGFRSVGEGSGPAGIEWTAGVEGDLLRLFNRRRLTEPDTQYLYSPNFPGDTLQRFTVATPDLVRADFDETGQLFSAFVRLRRIFWQRLVLQAGLRWDYNGFSAQSLPGPRISASYLAGRYSSFSLALGRYAQDPVYAELADQSGRRLQMEQVQHAIFSYRYQPAPGRRWMAEAWYKDGKDLVVRPFPNQVLLRNGGSGRAWGFDLHFSQKLVKRFHGQAGYSFMRSLRNDGPGQSDYPFAFDQPHQFNALLSYSSGKRWVVSGKYRYATGKPTDRFIVHSDVLRNPAQPRYSREIAARNAGRLPDFSSLDIRVNYRFQSGKRVFTAFMDVVNVLNRRIANAEGFNPLSGKSYYEGIAIFPSGGLRFEF